MLWTIFFVMVSFFAIIGVMEFSACIIEMISTHTTKSVREIRVVADMEGNEPHLEFVLGSLVILADRIAFKNVETKVCIRDKGLDRETYQRILDYIEENSNIYLIENDNNV